MEWGTLLSVAVFILLAVVMMRGCGGMMGGGGCGMGRDSQHCERDKRVEPDNSRTGGRGTK